MSNTRRLLILASAVALGGIIAAVLAVSGPTRRTAAAADPVPDGHLMRPGHRAELRARRASQHAQPREDPSARTAGHPPQVSGHPRVHHPVHERVEIRGVSKASGPLGRTIAEIHAQRGQLKGKRVRVRGVVVRAVPEVLNRTFVHLQDGTGSPHTETHDLTVTTHTTPRVGATVLCQGVLSTDKEYGTGHVYPAVLENARVVPE